MEEKGRENFSRFVINAVLIIIIGFVLGYGIGNWLKRQEGNPPMFSGSEENQGLPEVSKENDSVEQKAAFAQRIKDLAQEVNHMEVKENCIFSPEIARISEGSSFSFINKSSSEYQIRIATKDLTIPPGEKRAVIAQFEYGAGIYGITCNMQEKGFLEVVAK